MYQAYCIYKPTPLPDDTAREIGMKHAVERQVAYRNGVDCYAGTMDLRDVSLRDVPQTLHKLQDNNRALPFHSKFDDLDLDNKFRLAVMEMIRVGKFVRKEVSEEEEHLEEMASYGMTAWIEEGDETQSFFEFVTAHGGNDWDRNEFGEDVLACVDLACLKMYVGALQLNLVYHQGSFYCTFRSADSEQPLFDREFPNIGRKGQGFQMKTYDDAEAGDAVEFSYKKLMLWQISSRKRVAPSEVQSARKRLVAGEGKTVDRGDEAKTQVPDDDLGDEEIDDTDYHSVDPEVLWGKKNSAFYGSYNQTYVMFKPDPELGDDQKRQAFFRYGNWCYGGYVNMDQSVKLVDVPLILRKFQKQQGKLKYMCEIAQLPDHLAYTEPMKHLAAASAFLEKEVIKSEDTLSTLNDRHLARNEKCWVDEESGRQYFELTTSGMNPVYRDVELMASKTYFREVVLIILYCRGSYYVTLSPCMDDQPLLDMSFPDVSTKGRGFHLATYRHPEYQKLLLWQGERSVWQVANRAVLADRARQAEEKRKKELQQQRKLEASMEQMSVDKAKESKTAGNQDNDDELEEVTPSTSVPKEEKSSSEPGPGKLTGVTSNRSNEEMKSQGTGVRAPHHIKPLGKLTGSKLPQLGGMSDGIPSEAPWDAFGRPKELFGKREAK